ncbi:hypothetical protein [Streptomyces sp. NPDC047042]|uniref:hypothetical protein n=1 Tax=Streptomyces sp. NPDC047042 TaxID=3154807 RepID=UPI00340103FD
MLPNPENNIEPIAKLLGVSFGTLYNHSPTGVNSSQPGPAESCRPVSPGPPLRHSTFGDNTQPSLR